ncbi:MAG: NADH-quinone oxidoreductase subunit NuoF [Anaerolineales bacterium]
MSGLITKYKTIDPKIKELAKEFDFHPEAITEIYQELHKRNGWLDKKVIENVANLLEIPIHKAYGVATFYSMFSLEESPKKVFRICDGPVCWLFGGQRVKQNIIQEFNNKTWNVERTSCLGLCDHAPASLINEVQYGPISLEKLPEIAETFQYRINYYSDSRAGEVRVMMKNAGKIDPFSIESALDHGSYDALKKSVEQLPVWTVEEIERSGLSGRGGAGFPVGRKWRFVADNPQTPKYIICNADESEPLNFKDRVLIETNPQQLIEGMAIAGYAIGASEGYIYIRGEYEYQANLLQNAIDQAFSFNLLGENILGSDYSFKIHVHRGSGAYICGEETALIESMEGKRGEPRLRPPYPPQAGLRGKPTLVNNVESYCAVPPIILNGSDWYNSISSYSLPGTKMFSTLGHIKSPGIFEAPFGITLRQIIENFGGGMKDRSKFKFALTGGAAGTIVPESLLDIPMDYSSVNKGVSIGAGGVLICDETVSVISMLREIINFFRVESCGKCTPCRVGTERLFEIISRLSERRGKQGDIGELISLAEYMHDSSFCGLGQSVSLPVQSAFEHFGSEFEDALIK